MHVSKHKTFLELLLDSKSSVIAIKLKTETGSVNCAA